MLSGGQGLVQGFFARILVSGATVALLDEAGGVNPVMAELVISGIRD